MSRLLLLFVVVPAVELVLLIEIGQRIGTLPTLGLIVVTGALGAYLARRQGLGVLRRMRQETAAGRLPAAQVMDGIIILIAGAVLMTPGVLTDAFGFFCLIPLAESCSSGYFDGGHTSGLERQEFRGRLVGAQADGKAEEQPRRVRRGRCRGSRETMRARNG